MKTDNKTLKGKYPETVLLRFVVTNPNFIPKGIKRVNRNPAEIIAKQKEMRKAADKEAPDVNIAPYVWELMKDAKYDFSSIHYYEYAEGKKGYTQIKYVIVAALSKNVHPFGYSAETMEAVFRLIVKDAWGFIHIHENPNDTTSVTLLHRLPEKGNHPNTGKLRFGEAAKDNEFVDEAI